MNNKLSEAVSIFKELGWGNVTLENILHLPLGTNEQKRTALAGLVSGEWGEFGETGKNTYGWCSYIDVDGWKLALFAVRIGINPQRATSVLCRSSEEMAVTVIVQRGAKYANDFIEYACASRRRVFEHSASAFGKIAVKLVDILDLDIPQNVEYMKDWSVYAASAMGLQAEIIYGETDFPSLELIKKRFIQHVVTGVTVNAPATGPFGAVLSTGVKLGWISRKKGLELVVTALDASVRPGDRRVWLNVLDELGISDSELREHTQVLTSLLTTGDSAVVSKLAPILIAQADDISISEVILASFSATTKKAKQLVLKSAINRKCPKGVDELVPWLTVLAGDSDKDVASLSAKLMKQWGIDMDVLPDETAEIQGLWRKTPAIWQVPPFELGHISPEQLTELAAMVKSQPEIVHDVTVERFLAMANAVARQNIEAARMSLRGLKSGSGLLDYVVCWVKGEIPQYGHDNERGAQAPLAARDYVVCLCLGKLPCILSMPSKEDLSISVPDLVQRITLYQENGTDVLEADLLLALTRLDLSTKTPESQLALHALDIPVVLQSGKKMPVSAAQVVLQYMDEPFKEQAMKVSKYGYWDTAKIKMPKSLCGFPKRFNLYMYELFSVFPHWGDASLKDVHCNGDVYHEQGLVLRQVARRASALPPGASINFLAAQRTVTPDAAEDSLLAVTEVWERGLLRPGVADVTFLDWSANSPSNLAALSSAFESIILEGILSVVWPIMDELISVSLNELRLLSGTAEIAELIWRFLPEVKYAVDNGIAERTSLDLPGIRHLAQRGGSSRAVSAARKIVDLLPSVDIDLKKDKGIKSITEPPFDKIWPLSKEVPLLIDDGVSITVDWTDTTSTNKPFLFTLTLPGKPEQVFYIMNNGWYYDLENEGHCHAYTTIPSGSFVGDNSKRVWLHWDINQNCMVAHDSRNWFMEEEKVKGTKKPPLSSSLLTVVIGLLAQDGDAIYFAPDLLRGFIEKGQIGEEIIRRATRTLLQSPVVSPAKLVRVLEKDIKLLHLMWPMLTESIASAGELVESGNNPPVWVNRILDIALRYAPYLSEAAKRGIIPTQDSQWTGLSQIASSKSKSTAVQKAKKLLVMLE